MWSSGSSAIGTDADQHQLTTYDAAYLPLALGFYGIARGRARRAYARFRPALGDDADGR